MVVVASTALLSSVDSVEAGCVVRLIGNGALSTSRKMCQSDWPMALNTNIVMKAIARSFSRYPGLSLVL